MSVRKIRKQVIYQEIINYRILQLSYKQYGQQSNTRQRSKPKYDYVEIAGIQMSEQSRVVISEMFLLDDNGKKVEMEERKWYINTMYAQFRSKGFSVTESKLSLVIQALQDLQSQKTLEPKTQTEYKNDSDPASQVE